MNAFGNRHLGLLGITLACLMGGCSSAHFDGSFHIKPPVPINATLCWNNPLAKRSNYEFQGKGTIGILARVDSVEEYATTHMVENDTHYFGHWYLVQCSVLTVEYGSWHSKRLVFAACQGSGGVVEYLPFDYVKGRFFAFGLRNTNGLPEITFREKRSHFPSHGVIAEDDYISTVENDSERARMLKTIRSNVGIEDVCEPFWSSRQLKNFLVVETRTDYQHSCLHLLDANTFKPIPFTQNDKGEIIVFDGDKDVSY